MSLSRSLLLERRNARRAKVAERAPTDRTPPINLFSQEKRLNRPTITRYLILILGAILGLGMTLDGLWARVFGIYLFPDALWLRICSGSKFECLGFAWPWIVVGTSWFGALAGLWIGASWGVRAARILALISFFYLWYGTLLSIFILIALSFPAIRQEWEKDRV